MTIYAEYYFLENLLLDYIIIKTTANILNMHISKHKIFIGSFFGALYSMIYFSQKFIFLYNIVFKIIFIVLIVAIVFSYKNIKEYSRILFTFYMVNIFLCGSVYFIIYFTGISQMTLSLLIIVIFISCNFLKAFYKNLKSFNLFKDTQKDILVNLDNNNISFKALLDTGNLLKDPISKNPVMIVDVKKLEDILPNDLIYIDYSIMDFKKLDYLLSKLNLEIANRFRIIPYKVVGNENGLILGIKADYIEIEGNKKSNIILGLSNFSDKDEYNAIINPNIL